MLVLSASVSSNDDALRWRPLRLDAKAALPIEGLVVVAGRSGARQLTCLGGRVKPSTAGLLLLLPLPKTQSSRTGSAAAPAIQVLEVGEVATQLLRDVTACFPTLERKNPLAAASSDDESNSDEDIDETRQRRRRDVRELKAKRDAAARHHAAATVAASPATAAFLATTRVRVLPSLSALEEAYAFDDAVVTAAAIQRDLARQFRVDSAANQAEIPFLCLEFPALASSAPSADQELNFGVVLVHDQNQNHGGANAAQFLSIPLPRQPRGYFTYEKEEEEDEVVYQDATVFTVGSKRESSEYGGGKTSEETVKNIRLRHASGTFCSLVYPALRWRDVVHNFSAALPQLGELEGELRSRRFMGIVPNRPVEIRLESR